MTNRRWFQFGLRTMFVVVTVLGVFIGSNAEQWRIAQERKDVAAWINQRNRDVQFTETEGVSFYRASPQSTGRVRYFLGDRVACWLYVKPHITENERKRIVRAFPEAKQFLHVEESTEHGDPR